MKFNNIKELYEYLVNTGDLYDSATETYFFIYNDAHALCTYSLTSEDMLKTARKIVSTQEKHLGAILGTGGNILDDEKYDCYRYEKDKNKRAFYLKPSIEFCQGLLDNDAELVPAEEFITLAKIEVVEEMQNNTPNGQIVDADTILADAVAECDYHFTGFAQDIFHIWKNSSDKKAVEQMFYAFTNIEFDKYLENCRKHITKQPLYRKIM